MKKNFDTRLMNDLFPQMPQSFADGLVSAAQKAEGSAHSDTITPAAQKPARRFPAGKFFAGVAAGVLVAACIVAAVFVPGIGRKQEITAAAEPSATAPENAGQDGTDILAAVPGNAGAGKIIMPHIGFWTHTYGVDYAVRIGIDLFTPANLSGTATVTVERNGTAEIPTTFTMKEDGILYFSGENLSFTARYDWDKDVLSVTLDGETADYERSTPVLAGSKWITWKESFYFVNSMDDQGMYLEFFDDGNAAITLFTETVGERKEYRYMVSGTTITLRAKDDEADIIQIHYAQSGVLIFGERYFFPTSDELILYPEREEIRALRAQYPEYFGLDISQGLKVYVSQFAKGMFSCVLVNGSDERSELEIGIQSRGITIEQMRLILSTYTVSPEQITIIPYQNPISSYWREIDEVYTGWITWLIKGTPFQEGDVRYPETINSIVFDVDGDGTLETCVLTDGSASEGTIVTFSVYRNGTEVYRNTFEMEYSKLRFLHEKEGIRLGRYFETELMGTKGILLHFFQVSIEDGVIVLTEKSSGEKAEYWGAEDAQWNMK